MRWLWFYQIIFIYSFPHFSVFSSFIHLLVIHSLFPFLPLIFPFFLLSLIHSSHFLCNTKLLMDWSTLSPVHWPEGYAMLMSPNENTTAVYGRHYQSNMDVRMRKVLAIPRSWCVFFSAQFGIISFAPGYSTLYLFVHWYPSRKKINYNPKTL